MNLTPFNNPTPFEQAFQRYETDKVFFNMRCIYCSHDNTISLMEDKDGGAFRKCLKCQKNFMATIMSPALNNYSYATAHLKGTN